MNEPDILTEVPENLKRLARLISRGFYSMEHAIVIDLLVRNPCMKEDDISELLKFDRKYLRALLNTLKNEKIVKVRMKVETDEEGKTTRHNYYFINYLVFVNVVKYKLDHVRRKIEMEERDNTSRASFKCPSCMKTYTDLEVDQLFDLSSQKFFCTFCLTEVEEDESAMPKKDARTVLARFNEQIQPVYELLRDCDNIRLAPELMEPEPTDIRQAQSRGSHNKPANVDRTKWSGDATRGQGFGASESTVTITMESEEELRKKEVSVVKDRPVWMTESTVTGASGDGYDKIDKSANIPEPTKAEIAARNNVSNEIETLLIIHEKKSKSHVPGAESDSSSSDSESEMSKKPTASAEVEEMGSEDDEDNFPLVHIGNQMVPINEVTDDMVSRMTAVEKAAYIKLGQEMYQNMYE